MTRQAYNALRTIAIASGAAYVQSREIDVMRHAQAVVRHGW